MQVSKSFVYLSTALAFLIFANQCYASTTEISLEKVGNLIESDRTAIIIDLMPKIFYQNEHIPKAINIPIDVFKQELPVQVSDKSTKIILYCMGRQ